MATVTYTHDELIEAVRTSYSICEVLRKVGLFVAGGSHSHMKAKIQRLGLDISHFKNRKDHRPQDFHKRHWTTVLVDSARTRRENTNALRRALVESGRKYQCAICGNKGWWNGKILNLQIDHKNGKKSDNRPRNIRFLCPNCHTQTPGYAGAKQRSQRKQRVFMSTVGMAPEPNVNQRVSK